MDMVVTHWSANAAVLLACAAAVAAHLFGMRALAAEAEAAGQSDRPRATKGAVSFYFGVLVVVVAFVSPVGYWAQRHMWVRSLQDLLLAEVAPALIVLSAPWAAFACSLGLRRARPRRPAPEKPQDSSPAAVKAQQAWSSWPVRRQSWASWALAVTVALNVAWWVWHLPAPYQAALTSPWVQAAESVTYLVLGIAFWLQLIESKPVTPQFPPLRRVILVAGTVVSVTVNAMVLAFASGLLYPAYSAPDGGLAYAVSDQQVGGAILWVLSLPPYVIVAVALLARWLKNEETEALEAGLDRLLDPPTSAWPSRPGLR